MCKGIYPYSRHILVLALTTCKEKKNYATREDKGCHSCKIKKKTKKKRGEGNNMETGLKTKSIYVNIRYQVYSMLNSLYL